MEFQYCNYSKCRMHANTDFVLWLPLPVTARGRSGRGRSIPPDDENVYLVILLSRLLP